MRIYFQSLAVSFYRKNPETSWLGKTLKNGLIDKRKASRKVTTFFSLF
jgi:hypothetical protein